MTTHPLMPDDPDDREPLAEGGTWLLDLVAAVDHLRRGHRPGLTVWDALEEALRWSDPTAEETAWDDPDPLATSLRRFLTATTGSIAAALQTAVRHWTTTMAERYNNGHHWPHPPRCGFPPPLLAVVSDE